MSQAIESGVKADPAITWPGNERSLGACIGALQRLNPSLDLQCATTETGHELLTYARTDSDPVEVILPEPAADEFMVGVTYAHRNWYPFDTDLGTIRLGPHRFNRTSTGNLIIRPQSDAVSDMRSRFSLRFHLGLRSLPRDEAADRRWQIILRWVIPSGLELWEVEFAFLPRDHFDNARTEREWWATVPIGVISFVDRFDLPLEEHHARAQEVVVRGAQFASVGDIERGEMLVFRPYGVEPFTEDFRLPEMDWFDIPIRRKTLNA